MIDLEGKYLNKYFGYIHQRITKRSIFITGEKNIDSFTKILKSFEKSSLFYLMTIESNFTHWRQIITFNDSPKVVSNHLKFNKNGTIIEEYDLQGAEVVATSLTWEPFNAHKNCNDEGNEKTSFVLSLSIKVMLKVISSWSLQVFVKKCQNDYNNSPITKPKQSIFATLYLINDTGGFFIDLHWFFCHLTKAIWNFLHHWQLRDNFC